MIPILICRDVYSEVARACIVSGNPTGAYVYARLAAMSIRSLRD